MSTYDPKKVEVLKARYLKKEEDLKNMFRAAGRKAGATAEELSELISQGAHLDEAFYGFAPGSSEESELKKTLTEFNADRNIYIDPPNYGNVTELQPDAPAAKPKGLMVTDAKGATYQFDDHNDINIAIQKNKFDPKGATIVDLDNPSNPAVGVMAEPKLAGATYTAPERPKTITEAISKQGRDSKDAKPFTGLFGGQVDIPQTGQNKYFVGAKNLMMSPGATINAFLSGEFTKAQQYMWDENQKATKLGVKVPFPEVTQAPGSGGAFMDALREGKQIGTKALPKVAGAAGNYVQRKLGGEIVGQSRGLLTGYDSEQMPQTTAIQGFNNLLEEGIQRAGRSGKFGSGAFGLGLEGIQTLTESVMTPLEVQKTKSGTENLLRVENERMTAKENMARAQEIMDAVGAMDPSRKGSPNAGVPVLDSSLVGLVDLVDFNAGDKGVMTRSEGIKQGLMADLSASNDSEVYDDIEALTKTGKGKLGDANAYARKAMMYLTQGKSKYKPEKETIIPLYGLQKDDGSSPDEEYFLVKGKSGWIPVRSDTKTGAMNYGNRSDVAGAKSAFDEIEAKYKDLDSSWSASRTGNPARPTPREEPTTPSR